MSVGHEDKCSLNVVINFTYGAAKTGVIFLFSSTFHLNFNLQLKRRKTKALVAQKQETMSASASKTYQFVRVLGFLHTKTGISY